VGAGCAVLATLVLAAKAGEVEVGALAEVEGLIGVAGVPFFFLPFLATVTQVFPKGFGALRAGKSSGQGFRKVARRSGLLKVQVGRGHSA
jgi:hypothetical protein